MMATTDDTALILHTVEDVARILRIGRSRAYELVKRGEVPSIRVGHRIRVPDDALRAWLRQASKDARA